MTNTLFKLLLAVIITSCQNKIRAPADFAFKINDYSSDIDTFQSTFTRRGLEGYGNKLYSDTIITLQLTPQQKDSIYTLMGQASFFVLPEVITVPCEGRIIPSSTDNLLVRANGQVKKVEFDNGCITKDDKVKKFQNLLSFIYAMINRNESVNKLPKSKLFTL